MSEELEITLKLLSIYWWMVIENVEKKEFGRYWLNKKKSYNNINIDRNLREIYNSLSSRIF